ncbi:hypothetical protein LXL04_012822 [Taraxacum kok-saghyz]
MTQRLHDHSSNIHTNILSFSLSSDRSLMAMRIRSTIIPRSSPLLHSIQSSIPRSLRFFSDEGKVLDKEERARENLYVKKMEKEKLDKQKDKLEGKEKDDKVNSDKKP